MDSTRHDMLWQLMATSKKLCAIGFRMQVGKIQKELTRIE